MAFRAFVAVPAPAEPPLVELLEELARLPTDLRPVRPDHLHFTLSFLGQVPDEARDTLEDGIREAARGVAPFRARLQGVGAFPSARRPRVVWVGVEDPRPISELAMRVREALAARGHPGDTKDFRAHLTLARVRSDRGLGELVTFLKRHGSERLPEIDVGEVRLYQSVLSGHRPSYETLATAPLEA